MPQSLRPKTLDELIGQDHLKKKARVAIGAALARTEPLPHVLQTSSGGGLGKTTFAQILANEMYAHMISTSGPCIGSVSDLRKALIQLKPNDILHIDEIHAIGRQAAEELLLVLEERILNLRLEGGPLRLPLPPFTLIGSTTRPSAIAGPLMQRFGLHFHFDFYSMEDLTLIVRRMSESLGMPFDDEVCRGIAERGLGIPRIALRHAERVRDVASACNLTRATALELEKAMNLEGVDHLGLNAQHRMLLTRLAGTAPRPVSARTLSLAIGVESSTVTCVLEPPLVRIGLMTIGPGGRQITKAGLVHIKAVPQAPEHLASISRAIGEQ